LLLEALMALLLVVRASREKAKKPFVVTERVKRLIAIHAAVNTLLAFILLWISPVLAYLLPAFEPALLMLAARLLKRIAPAADVAILEQHFREKPEISGTAKKIAATLSMEDEEITSLRASR
jgi:hypothetical protein